MSYLVMARKYRPATFAQLVGQEHVVRTLQNALRKDQVSHAYLFTGTRGVGKTTAARILAKALNCEHGPALEPCNECTSCREIGEARSLDVIEIDGASNNRVEEVRQLRENVKFAPAHGRYKIYIIDEVHMLTTAAFNALLKTLEEPPEHIKFILATTEPEKVPATIQSRCQRFDFRLLTREEIVAQIDQILGEEKTTLDRRIVLEIARAAQGSLRDAESLLDQALSFAGGEAAPGDVAEVLHLISGDILERFFRAVVERDAAALIREIDGLAERGYEMGEFLKEIMEWLRGMLLVKASAELITLVPLMEEERALLAELAGRLSAGRVQALVQLALEAEREIKRSSAPRYAMELYAVKMAQTADFDALGALIGRLEELSSRLPAGGLRSAAPPLPDRPPLQRPAPEPPVAVAAVPPPDLLPPSSGEDEAELEDPPSTDMAAPAGEGAGWERFLSYVKQRKMSLGSFLEHGKMLGQDEDGIVIGFATNQAFAMENAQDRKNKELLHEAAVAVFGGKGLVRLQILDGEEGEAATPVALTDLARKRHREALKNPLVLEIIDTFGGKVLDVKTTSERRKT